MGYPLAVRATIFMSGLFGLRFGIDNQKTMETEVPFNLTLENQTLEIMYQNDSKPVSISIATSETTTTPFSTPNREARQAKTFEIPGFGLRSTFDFANNENCGPTKCREGTTCVTWVKDQRFQSRRSKGVRDSPMLLHECVVQENIQKNERLHQSLCPSGENAVVEKYAEECDESIHFSCPQVWKYRCLKT